jgi:hypothetical protein
MGPLCCTPENAPSFAEWIATRDGVALWRSVDLSDCHASWSTPLNEKDGTPTPSPHWKAQKSPRIITQARDIVVVTHEEVKRFRVGVRRGSQGLSYKVTDGGTRRIRAAVDKAGEGAFYEFDYGTQEAVIKAPTSTTPLDEWMVTHALIG